MWRIEKIQELKGHAGAVYDLCRSGKVLYSGGSDGIIVKWDTDNGNGEVFAQTHNPVFSMFIPDELPYLFSGNQNGKLFQFDIDKKSILHQADFKESIFSLCFSPSGRLLTGTEKGNIFEISMVDFSIKKTMAFSQKSVRKIIESDNRIFVAYSDFFIREIDAEKTEIIQEWKGHENSVFTLAIHQDILFSGGRDAMLKFWDLKQHVPQNIQSIPAHLGHINDIKINPEKNIFATASMDKTIKIWDLATGKLLKVIDGKYEGHLSSVNKLLWLNGTTLASCSDDRKIMIWAINDTNFIT